MVGQVDFDRLLVRGQVIKCKIDIRIFQHIVLGSSFCLQWVKTTFIA